MTEFAERAEEYLAAWNEPDVGAIRAHLESSVNPAVIFSDPANRTVGIDALEAVIREARTAFPDASYAQSSVLDGGHDSRYRYTWEVRTGGEVMPGMDCTTVDDQNRFLRIDGFFGKLD